MCCEAQGREGTGIDEAWNGTAMTAMLIAMKITSGCLRRGKKGNWFAFQSTIVFLNEHKPHIQRYLSQFDVDLMTVSHFTQVTLAPFLPDDRRQVPTVHFPQNSR